jgi:HlyD family secretion protein
MIRRIIFYIVWLVVVAVLVFYSINYKGGEEAMVAQVESEVTAISYQKPVMVRKVYVNPGQVVDSGDLLLEVERPDLDLNFEKKYSEKQQAENGITETEEYYANSLKILTTKYEGNRRVLQAEKEELQYEMQMVNNSRKRMDSVSSLSFTTNDTVRFNRIKLIDDQLNNLLVEFEIEKRQLSSTYQNNTYRYQSELAIIEKELDELEIEKEQLIRRAEKRSTIGNLFVQLNELVPPYKTLLTVYDINPTLIKAFVHERGVENLQIGVKVMVESVNRQYKIEGQIMEIGSRITAYPDKINPLLNQRSYGQEIFINIPNDNNFLNGEKVYVYIVEDEG